MTEPSDEVIEPDEVISPDGRRSSHHDGDPRTGHGSGGDERREVPPFVDRLAFLLDDLVRIPIIGRRIGIDGAIGMVPGLGDGAGLVASTVIILTAVRQGVSIPTVVRMIGNVLVESFVGVVPFLGDLFDFVWKSNSKNVALLREDLTDPETTRRSSVNVLAISAVVVVTLVAITGAAMLASIWLLVQLAESIF